MLKSNSIYLLVNVIPVSQPINTNIGIYHILQFFHDNTGMAS